MEKFCQTQRNLFGHRVSNKCTCTGDGMGLIKMFTSSLQPSGPSESKLIITIIKRQLSLQELEISRCLQT